jgi:hypothetical protein
MKTRTRTLFTITILAMLGAIALGLHFGALAFLGIVAQPPVTYTLGDLSLQNGWDGGSGGGGFTNNNAGSDIIVNTIAFDGTQSWQYGGSYGSPGAGTPFTPQVVTVGALNAKAAGSLITPAGNKSVVSFAFMAAAAHRGDGSGFSVYEGSYARDQRTGASLYLENDTANGNPAGTVSLYNFSSDNDAPDCNTSQVDLGFVTAGEWHTVEMTTVYPDLTVGDPTTYGSTTYVIDKGTAFEQPAVTMQSWMHAWRHCNGANYVPGGSLKFSSFYNDYPTHQGFYIDDVSMTVINTDTLYTVATFATGFEGTLPTVTPTNTPTNTPVAPTSTPVPPTSTPVPPTNTPIPTLTPTPAVPVIAFVKTVGTASHGQGFFTSLQVTPPPTGVAGGNSIIISIYASSNTVTFACSDTKFNVYSQNVAAGGGGVPRSAVVSAHNVTALVSGDTITCTFPNSSTTSGMSVNEFSGLIPAPLDGTASASGTNTSPNSGLTPITTQTNELVFGFVHSISFTPATSGSLPSETYANPPNSDPYHFAGQFGSIWPVYRIVSTTRQYQTNGTGGGSGGWRAMIATYKGF